MTRRRPRARQISILTAGRFAVLSKPLTKRFVQGLFKDVLANSAARLVSKEVRTSYGTGDQRYVVSFLCFQTRPVVTFLKDIRLEEKRYGHVLLIERHGHLALFHHLARGLDQAMTKGSKPVDRHRMTHMWSEQARYERFTTRRMTVSPQELRGASYEAADLETAIVPATAARSIVQNLSLVSREHGTVAITPSTGRVRVGSARAGLQELFSFVDSAIDGFGGTTDSPFLNAFPSPVEVHDLPDDVVPTGLLLDGTRLDDTLAETAATLGSESNDSIDELRSKISHVLALQAHDDQWNAIDDSGCILARIKRLTHSFGLYADVAKGFSLHDAEGSATPLDRWLRDEHAFSLSFSSPEYFYAVGKLFKTGGFPKETSLVRRCLSGQDSLGIASSEKGSGYPQDATRFATGSLFRIVEDSLAIQDTWLWCGDLGDEWADYIGIRDRVITFFHCKYGTATTGASNLQTVIGQALKNLGRVKFRPDEITSKLQTSSDRGTWGQTNIPLLARGGQGWEGLRLQLLDRVADPITQWRVALVVNALSVTEFDAAAAQTPVKPHFVQLVYLLSAFISSCRERDAQPVVFCRP